MSYDDSCHCVVCGESLMGKDYGNHHCDPKRIERIESARKASSEFRSQRQPTISERLSLGNFINNLNGAE